MFTMMNPARLSIGLQGLSVGETASAEARSYAAERHQGTVVKGKSEVGAMIDSYPDVRRMLALMRSALDAMRLVVYTTAINSDRAAAHPDAETRARAEDLVALLTPIAKAGVSDLGVEIASLGIQVFGGSGYIEDGPAPQRLRDARIAPIYEGTNGIQAIDLLGGWLLAKRVLSRTDPRSAREALDVAYFYAAERLTTVPGRAVAITAGAGRLFI